MSNGRSGPSTTSDSVYHHHCTALHCRRGPCWRMYLSPVDMLDNLARGLGTTACARQSPFNQGNQSSSQFQQTSRFLFSEKGHYADQICFRWYQLITMWRPLSYCVLRGRPPFISNCLYGRAAKQATRILARSRERSVLFWEFRAHDAAL